MTRRPVRATAQGGRPSELLMKFTAASSDTYGKESHLSECQCGEHQLPDNSESPAVGLKPLRQFFKIESADSEGDEGREASCQAEVLGDNFNNFDNFTKLGPQKNTCRKNFTEFMDSKSISHPYLKRQLSGQPCERHAHTECLSTNSTAPCSAFTTESDMPVQSASARITKLTAKREHHAPC